MYAHKKFSVLFLALALTFSLVNHATAFAGNRMSVSKPQPRRGIARKAVFTTLVAASCVGLCGYGKHNARIHDRQVTAYHDAKETRWGKLSPSAADAKIQALSQYPIGAPAGREILLAQVNSNPKYQALAKGIPLDSEQGFLGFTGYHLESKPLVKVFGLPVTVATGEENWSAKLSPSVQRNRERVRKLSYAILTDLYRQMYEAGQVGPDFGGEELRAQFLAPWEAQEDRRLSRR
jgi:hypothetical protein